MEEPWTVFGKVLRKLRIERQLSQAQLADYTDLDQTTISLLERGKRQPTLPTLYALSQALEIPLSEFLSKLEKS